MPQIGWLELIIIIGLSIVIIGPKDFPVVLKKIGSWFGSVKRYVNNLQNEMTNLEENSIEINNQTFDINNPSKNEEKKVDKKTSIMWGTYRSLINNAVIGSSIGYEKILELVGVGYRAALKGNQLNLQLGYSHDINFNIPEGIKITVEKQTILKITGVDKQQVGSVASKIKTLRKIEPYKGKGVREKGQYILKKEGKKK